MHVDEAKGLREGPGPFELRFAEAGLGGHGAVRQGRAHVARDAAEGRQAVGP